MTASRLLVQNERLLAPDEPPPVCVYRPDGRSAFFLTCDHAGRAVPAKLGRLGLAACEFDRHIAWDIGAAAVSRGLADRLDAVLVEQRYSRLVVDCNRPPDAENAIPAISEATPVAGNRDIAAADRSLRIEEVFRPYHDRIAGELDRRAREGRQSVLVAMHSFTPVYIGVSRPWHVGTLYGRDARLARALHAELVRDGRFTVGDNEPYSVSDESDYTIPVHGERRGLLHVGIEIRQDLVATPDGQAAWAHTLSRILPAAAQEVIGP